MMAPPEASPGQEYLVTEEMLLSRRWDRGPGPFFRVDEVAKIFFGMSASWLRLRMTPDPGHPETWFTYPDGSRIEFRRAVPDKSDSARVFLLSDIEPMARSLLKYGMIKNDRYTKILRVVEAIAQIFNLFDDPPEPADAGEGDPPDGDDAG